MSPHRIHRPSSQLIVPSHLRPPHGQWPPAVTTPPGPARPDMSFAKLWYKLDEAADPLVNSGDGGARDLVYVAGTAAPTYGVAGGIFGDCLEMASGAVRTREQNATNDAAWFGHGETLWAWITPQNFGAETYNRMAWGCSTDTMMISLRTDFRVQCEVQFADGVGWNALSAAGVFAWGDLLFLAVTCDGTAVRIYVNGVEQGSRVYASDLRTYAGYRWTLGTQNTGAWSQCPGQYHDVGFDDTVLSAAQLLAIYESVVP